MKFSISIQRHILMAKLTKEEDPVALKPTQLHQMAMRGFVGYMVVTLHLHKRACVRCAYVIVSLASPQPSNQWY